MAKPSKKQNLSTEARDAMIAIGKTVGNHDAYVSIGYQGTTCTATAGVLVAGTRIKCEAGNYTDNRYGFDERDVRTNALAKLANALRDALAEVNALHSEIEGGQ